MISMSVVTLSQMVNGRSQACLNRPCLKKSALISRSHTVWQPFCMYTVFLLKVLSISQCMLKPSRCCIYPIRLTAGRQDNITGISSQMEIKLN